MCIAEKYIVLKYCWTSKGLYLHRQSEQISLASLGPTEEKA
jgi:hypothetical protein